MSPTDREALAALCLAVDAPSLDEARRWAEPLAAQVGVLKIGLELFTREGPAAVAWARSLGRDVFLDLKLHDIPQTVERAVASCSALGAAFLTVHASGGPAMLARAARRAADEGTGLRLLAVTVLTSLDDTELAAIGVPRPARAHALALARLAREAGVRGMVCSGVEVGELRAALPDAFLATPGVRPAGPRDDADDQRRVVRAEDAVAAGSDLVVVGRPLRDAPDPAAAARALRDEIAAGLARRAPRPAPLASPHPRRSWSPGRARPMMGACNDSSTVSNPSAKPSAPTATPSTASCSRPARHRPSPPSSASPATAACRPSAPTARRSSA